MLRDCAIGRKRRESLVTVVFTACIVINVEIKIGILRVAHPKKHKSKPEYMQTASCDSVPKGKR